MNRNERVKIAEETVKIIKQGYYYIGDKKIYIEKIHSNSLENSSLVIPEECSKLEEKYKKNTLENKCSVIVINESTVKATLDLINRNLTYVGVLNFASSKNPGGGFLNGALAQEESIALSSGLYDTQIKNEKYYLENRACKTMMYTDNMIYSKDVVFIRDDNLKLLNRPVTASIITAPAVNFGQVLLKRENSSLAKITMKNRMRKVLALFADRKDKNLVLGAYGCGVFRNDPKLIASYFKELLYDENFISYFDNIVFAVLDKSKDKKCIKAFEEIL